MPGQQQLHIQPGHALNAFFDLGAITAGQVGAPEAVLKDQITGKQRFWGRPVNTDRARGMTGCVEYL